MSVKPYSEQMGNKKEQVTAMFNNIAPKYDLLNHLLSFGVDKIWRRKVVKIVKKLNAKVILDVATGTGDLAIALAKCNPIRISAVDISAGMLDFAREKVAKKNLQRIIYLQEGDSESLPYSKNEFDVVTVAFGVRNFGDLRLGLSQMNRVLKPGGHIIVLEFSKPNKFPMKQFYNFYFTKILPWWAGLISPDKHAYSYLPASVMSFPDGELFDNELSRAGFMPANRLTQTFGIATIYVAQKPLQ